MSKTRRRTRMTCKETCAVWGGFKTPKDFISKFAVSESDAPKELDVEVRRNLFSLHINTTSLFLLPLHRQRIRKFSQAAVNVLSRSRGDNLAIIGPHSARFINNRRTEVVAVLKTPPFVPTAFWIIFSGIMTFIHAWFILASIILFRPMSAVEAAKDWFGLVLAGPCAFSTYFVLRVK